MADEEFDTMSPELFAELASAAEFLLPVAEQHVASGKWPQSVATWLFMMREQSLMSCATIH